MLRQFFAYYAPYRGLFLLDFGCAVLAGLRVLGGGELCALPRRLPHSLITSILYYRPVSCARTKFI